jgi:hypothetical protein
VGCKAAPVQLLLDVDATHVPLYGAQEGAHFHAHYDSYCYLPLYVFCGAGHACLRLASKLARSGKAGGIDAWITKMLLGR